MKAPRSLVVLYCVLMAVILLGPLALLPKRKPLPQEVPTSAPSLTLQKLARRFKEVNNVAGAERVLEFARDLERGAISIETVEPTPIFATIGPAYWLEQPDLFYLTVMIFARPNAQFRVVLLNEGMSLGEHIPESKSAYRLTEGLHSNTWSGYVDAQWRPVSSTPQLPSRRPLPSDSVISEMIDDLAQRKMELNVQVGNAIVPVRVPPKPDFGDSQ